MKNTILTLLFPVLILANTSLFASSERHIHMNAQHLTTQFIIKLDKKNGATVPDGDYWLNSKTGQWGFEGSPKVMGTINTATNHNKTSQGIGVVTHSYEKLVVNSQL